MMTSTTFGISNYSSTLFSPISSYKLNPTTNFMYGAMVSKMYSQNFAKAVQSNVSSYLSSLSSNVTNLKASAKSLSSKSVESSFDQKSVTSSDTNAVTGVANSDADLKAYTLNVSKLAKNQVNTGNSLNSVAPSSFDIGTNTFSLKVGSKEKNISFNIDITDTNKSGLEKMAKSINYAKMGVTANVYSDSKTGTSYLRLASDKTGTDNSFTLMDITGNAVSVTGMNNISQGAQNAEYTLDGKQYTSQENTVEADNGKVTFTLNKADGKDIKLTVGNDTKAISEDIKDFVQSYNNLVKFTNSNSSSFNGATHLKSELDGIIKSHKSSLEVAGITTNVDGTLSVDNTKLEKTLSESFWKVKDTLGGSNGLADQVYNKASDVLYSPMKYSQSNEFKKDFTSFYNYMSSSNRMFAPQNLYTGLLFDTTL